jgi:hypothetical protein
MTACFQTLLLQYATYLRHYILDGPLVFDVDRLMAGGTAYAFEGMVREPHV